MSVIIGIDPHKALHAACVIDNSEVELGELLVRTGPRQLSDLLAWAAPFEDRTWAIESAGGLGYLLAQHSSRTANGLSMCRRRCRRECGCSVRVGRTRTTPTTPGRLLSPRCGHR